jgi:hypothetical protein
MNEENRIRILNMLKDGTITVEEAEKLLSAIGEKSEAIAEPVSLKDTRGRKGKKFRIVVDSEDERKKNARVNVSIPVSLIKTLGPIVTRYIPKEAKDEMDNAGIDIAAIMEGIEMLVESGSEEDIVNVDVGEGEDKTKVRIYVE